MNCQEIAEFAPLYLSGELDGARIEMFDGHFAECPDCREQIERYAATDIRLREAFELPEPSKIEHSVRRRIASQRSRRWQIAAAAAVFIAAFLGYRMLRPERLYSDAARDHRTEVVEGQPRHWRTKPEEIAQLAARYGLADPAPAGYRLERAKMCGLAGQPALHMVFTNGAQEFSLYVQTREGAGKSALRAVHVGADRLAAFETDRLAAVAVSSGSNAECLQFARAVSAAL